MIALILVVLLSIAAFLCADLHRLHREHERARRFERRMHMEAWLDGRLAARREQREKLSERARKGWQTRRAG